MNDIEKIKELNIDLTIKLSQISDEMNIEQARELLLISECTTARLQAYFFKFLAREEG